MIHDLANGASRELSAHGDTVDARALDASGTRLATGDISGTVRLGSINGEKPHLFLGHPARVEPVEFDPLGRWVASGDSAGLLRIWPIPEGQPFHTLALTELLSRFESLTNYRGGR